MPRATAKRPATTSRRRVIATFDDAVRAIQEMMPEAREGNSGIHLTCNVELERKPGRQGVSFGYGARCYTNNFQEVHRVEASTPCDLVRKVLEQLFPQLTAKPAQPAIPGQQTLFIAQS